MTTITRINIDWSDIKSDDDFYDLIFAQAKSPEWHGRNLNALGDSWITGDINALGPPYDFIFSNNDCVIEILESFSNAVWEIALESVNSNGGTCVRA